MHWYTKEGRPLHEIEGANGEMRPTTLRDARKLKLVPSVTTIMGIQDKPALLTWTRDQILNAVLRVPRPLNTFDLVGCGHSMDEIAKIEQEQIDLWRFKVLAESQKFTQNAQAWGSRIHNALEDVVKNNVIDNELLCITAPVIKFLESNFPDAEWVAEKSFCHNTGFGGCVDLHCPKTNIVLDFKTKKKSAEQMKKLRAYDDHHMQTASYTVGLGLPKDTKRYNLFIGYDVDEGGDLLFTDLKLTESTDFEREWNMFKKLLEFWQLKNKYVP
jgi:hypothetical protein